MYIRLIVVSSLMRSSSYQVSTALSRLPKSKRSTVYQTQRSAVRYEVFRSTSSNCESFQIQHLSCECSSQSVSTAQPHFVIDLSRSLIPGLCSRRREIEAGNRDVGHSLIPTQDELPSVTAALPRKKRKSGYYDSLTRSLKPKIYQGKQAALHQRTNEDKGSTLERSERDSKGLHSLCGIPDQVRFRPKVSLSNCTYQSCL